MSKVFSIFGKVVLTIIIVVVFLCVAGYIAGKPQKDVAWGINYSSLRAKDLGMEPVGLLRIILTDLHPQHVRLPAYWSELEPEQGKFDFQTIDSLLTEIDKTDTKVVVVLGRKQPRWPECHQPLWWNNLPPAEQDEAVLEMISRAAEHLRLHESISAWQIENEPFFEYGPDCPTISRNLYAQEITTLKLLDPRPVIGTDSGEKGPWITTAWAGVDILGATMYREVFLDKKGYYQTYPLPAWTYNVKAGLVRMFSSTNKTIGVELQAEPWFAGGDAQTTPIEKQLKHMNAEIFERNVGYATKTGFSENYLWGAEWWYWLQKNHQNDSMVGAAKQLFNK